MMKTNVILDLFKVFGQFGQMNKKKSSLIIFWVHQGDQSVKIECKDINSFDSIIGYLPVPPLCLLSWPFVVKRNKDRDNLTYTYTHIMCIQCCLCFASLFISSQLNVQYFTHTYNIVVPFYHNELLIFYF